MLSQPDSMHQALSFRGEGSEIASGNSLLIDQFSAHPQGSSSGF
jgi:hypothetical protein